jgi:hypothetical protein
MTATILIATLLLIWRVQFMVMGCQGARKWKKVGNHLGSWWWWRWLYYQMTQRTSHETDISRVKMSPRLHTTPIRMYRGVEVGHCALSNSALGKWSAVSHGRFIPPSIVPSAHCTGSWRVSWLVCSLWREISLAPNSMCWETLETGFDSLVVQCVRYLWTDYYIQQPQAEVAEYILNHLHFTPYSKF